jgi:hypothetical protein
VKVASYDEDDSTMPNVVVYSDIFHDKIYSIDGYHIERPLKKIQLRSFYENFPNKYDRREVNQNSKEKSRLKAYFRKYPNLNAWEAHPLNQFEQPTTAFQVVRAAISEFMKSQAFTIYGKNSNPGGTVAVKNFMTILLKVTSELYHVCIVRWWNSLEGKTPLSESYDFKVDKFRILTKANLKRFMTDFIIRPAADTTVFLQFLNQPRVIELILNSVVYHAELVGITVDRDEDGMITNIVDPEVERIHEIEKAREENVLKRKQPGYAPKRIDIQPAWKPSRERRSGLAGTFGIKPREYVLPSDVSFKYRPSVVPKRLSDLLKKKVEEKRKEGEEESEEQEEES